MEQVIDHLCLRIAELLKERTMLLRELATAKTALEALMSERAAQEPMSDEEAPDVCE